MPPMLPADGEDEAEPLTAADFAQVDAYGHGDALHRLFEEIGSDERFHAGYSRQILDSWRAEGRAEEVERAIRSVRLQEAWMGWRRAGRRIGRRFGRWLGAVLGAGPGAVLGADRAPARRRFGRRPG